jgi:predicted amidophosphoribosyltransferase
VNIDPVKIAGPWTEGFSLDRHVQSAVPIGYSPGGHLQFETKRTALGELVYQLKYGGKKDAVAAIADVVEEFVRGRWGDEFDVVVPAPPSIVRAFQPLVEIARALATGLAVPLCEDVVKKVKVTPQMKNLDVRERERLLQVAIQNGPGDVRGRRVLLIDDVIESGATLRRVARVLLSEAGAQSVHALVITRTK